MVRHELTIKFHDYSSFSTAFDVASTSKIYILHIINMCLNKVISLSLKLFH